MTLTFRDQVIHILMRLDEWNAMVFDFLLQLSPFRIYGRKHVVILGHLDVLMTSPNDQKPINLVSLSFTFYGQHARLCSVTLAQLGATRHGVILPLPNPTPPRTGAVRKMPEPRKVSDRLQHRDCSDTGVRLRQAGWNQNKPEVVQRTHRQDGSRCR